MDASLGPMCDPVSLADVAGVFLKTNKIRVLIYASLEEVPHLTSCGYSTPERLKVKPVRPGTWDQRFGPSGDRSILITDWSTAVASWFLRFAQSEPSILRILSSFQVLPRIASLALLGLGCGRAWY